MRTSESTTNIFPALAKAQGEMSNPPKNADNPFFHSAYADHPTILNMARPILAKHGLALAQSYGEAGLTTVLTHESGEWMMTDPLPIKAEKVTAQGIGSAITYARRYAACALLNIAGEDDDDGNAASEAPKQEQKPAPTPAAKPLPKPEVERTPGGASVKSVNLAKSLFAEAGVAARGTAGESPDDIAERREQNLAAVYSWLKEHDFEVGDEDNPLLTYDQKTVSKVIETLKATD